MGRSTRRRGVSDTLKQRLAWLALAFSVDIISVIILFCLNVWAGIIGVGFILFKNVDIYMRSKLDSPVYDAVKDLLRKLGY
jgi:hypothetical protein